MDISELRESDLPELLSLCRAALPLDTFTHDLLERRSLRELERKPSYQLLARADGELVGAMLAGQRHRESGVSAGVRLFCVSPEHRRQDIASNLLEELVSRVRAAGLSRLSVGGVAPDYFWPGVDVRYTPALCFLDNHGFRRTSEALDMEVDLRARGWNDEQLEKRLLNEGFTVRRLRTEDIGQIEEWIPREWSPAWVTEALAGLENDPVTTWVAEHDGSIRSFASCNITAFPNSFGPTGTEPKFRGRGLGRLLFYRCMQDLKDRGHDTSEIMWVGPVAFYARVADAWINRVFWTFEKSL